MTKQKTKKQLMEDNLSLATALSMLLSASSNREAIMAVQVGKAALEKNNGLIVSTES